MVFVDFILAHDSLLAPFSVSPLDVNGVLGFFVLVSDLFGSTFASSAANCLSALLSAHGFFTFFESIFGDAVLFATFTADLCAVGFFESTLAVAGDFSAGVVNNFFASVLSDAFALPFAESPSSKLSCFASVDFSFYFGFIWSKHVVWCVTTYFVFRSDFRTRMEEKYREHYGGMNEKKNVVLVSIALIPHCHHDS